MGIQISDIVEAKEISLESLFNKKVAIDAFNWIYQFLSTIRQRDGQPLMDSKGRTTSHLSGLFYRTMKLMESSVQPVYVFDGTPPDFKHVENEKRRDARTEAAREWKEALKKEDYESARKFAQRSSTVTDEIIESSKSLLASMGIPVIQAPSEGEALCSLMTKRGDVYATATQDYDALLFACPRIIRNLSITGRKKRGNEYIVVNPELILLENTLKSMGLSQNQLVILAILVGTDYNPGGVQGYGPKKALELVKNKKSLDAVMKEIVWDFDVSPQEIYDFFLRPSEADYNIEFNELNDDEVKKILCDEHDFSSDRIENALTRLKDAKKKKQNSLNKWG